MLLRLGRLKIRQKLQLGFGTLILLIGILAVVTVNNNLGVRHNYQLLAQDAFPAVRTMGLAELKGADAVLSEFDRLKNSGNGKRPDEHVLNMIGYRVFMQADKPDDAFKVFAKNAQEFPESSNVYDSLAEAYAAVGKKDLAIENYEKSLKLDPNNENAKNWLKKLKAEK